MVIYMVDDKDIRFIAFTGHRYVKYIEMLSALDEVARRFPNAAWICGGTVGTDANAAEYAMSHAFLAAPVQDASRNS